MLTADYVNRMAREALGRCRRGTDGPEIRIDVMAFGREEELLRTHMLKLVLKELSKGKIMLPYGLEAVRSFGEVVLREKNGDAGEESVPETAFYYEIRKELLEKRKKETQQEAPVWQIDAGEAGVLEFSVFARENSQIIPQKTCTKWLDYDRIESLVLRTRRPGDYLAINDRLQKKRLKDYLIQEKIPVEKRENLLLLADGSHILWVVGHRISSAVKVTEDTKWVLRIHIRGGKENG